MLLDKVDNNLQDYTIYDNPADPMHAYKMMIVKHGAKVLYYCWIYAVPLFVSCSKVLSVK